MINLIQSQRIAQYQMQRKISKVMYLGGIPSVDPDELSIALEEALNDIQARPKSNGNGNYFYTENFGLRLRNEKPAQVVLQNPKFRVVLDGTAQAVEQLWDYSKLEDILSRYKNPEEGRRDPRECFTKKLKEEIDWVGERQKEIIKYILEMQGDAIKSRDPSKLQRLTQREIGGHFGLHETTISKLLKDISLELNNGRTLFVNDLIVSNPESVQCKNFLLELARIYGGLEVMNRIYSDRKLTEHLKEAGLNVARRTVHKYRTELLNGNLVTGSKRIYPEGPVLLHWNFDRQITEEEIYNLMIGNLDVEDREVLRTPDEDWGKAKVYEGVGKIQFRNIQDIPTTNLFYYFANERKNLADITKKRVAEEINRRTSETGYTAQEIEDISEGRRVW